MWDHPQKSNMSHKFRKHQAETEHQDKSGRSGGREKTAVEVFQDRAPTSHRAAGGHRSMARHREKEQIIKHALILQWI